TLVKRANAQLGTAEIWTATAPTRLINATVTATQSSGGFDQTLNVIAFIGSGGIGASAADSNNNTAPSVALTSTAAGSLVYGVGNDPDNRVARTLGANQTMVHQWVDTNGNLTFWVQSRSAPTVSAGSVVTINDTAPTGNRWNLAAVEIVPQ